MRSKKHAVLAVVGVLASAVPVAAQQARVELPRRTTELRERPVDLYSVGKEEGESWELLSRVQAVAFDANDNLYVMDAGNFRVLVFDAVGKFVRQIGGKGDGPGEITFATGLVVTTDGTVVVADMGRGAFSLFAADGKYLRQLSWGEGTISATSFQAGGRGGVVARMNPMFRFGPGQAPPTGPQKGSIQHHALTERGSFQTLFEYDLPQPRVTSSGGSGERRVEVRMMGPPTFAPQVSWGALPSGGIALVADESYAVHIHDAAGRPVRTIVRDEKPRAVTERDRDRARDRQRAVLRGEVAGPGGINVMMVNGQRSFQFAGPPAMPADQIEQRIREMQFAEVMPLTQGIATDPTGRIWVERMAAPGETGAIELITMDGASIGTISGVARPAAVSRSGDRAAWIETDDLGVERVRVRRLPASWKVK